MEELVLVIFPVVAVAQEKQETLMDQVMEEMVLQALSQDRM
jgi:hypothetical protein